MVSKSALQPTSNVLDQQNPGLDPFQQLFKGPANLITSISDNFVGAIIIHLSQCINDVL